MLADTGHAACLSRFARNARTSPRRTEKRKAEAKAKRDHEKRARELEMHILSLEGRQKELTAELEKPETYEAGGAVMELNRELLAVTEELERLIAEWEAVSETTVRA